MQISGFSSEPHKLSEQVVLNLTESGGNYLQAFDVEAGAREIAVAFYKSGAIQLFEDKDDTINPGPILKFTHFSNVNSTRQNIPHSHCIVRHDAFSKSEFFVADLGADRIYLVRPQNKTSTCLASRFQ